MDYQEFKDWIFTLEHEVPDDPFSLTKREVEISKFLNHSCMPILSFIFKMSDLEKYKKWGGNMCRQGALICAAFLKELMPEYSWKIYDCNFEDLESDGRTVKYNHAYVFGIPKDNSRKSILVDMTRKTHNNLFIKRNANNYKGIASYDNMTLVNKTDTPEYPFNQIYKDIYDMYMASPEYYTGIDGFSLLKLVKEFYERGTEIA